MWLFWLILGVLIGYVVSTVWKNREIAKLRRGLERSFALGHELTAVAETAASTLAEKEASHLRFVDKSDQIFKSLNELSEQAIARVEELETQNGQISDSLKELRIKHERLLSTLN